MKIPMKVASGPMRSAAKSSRGLSIPLNLFGGTKPNTMLVEKAVADGNDELIRASVAAAALSNPAEGVRLAELAEQQPEMTIKPAINSDDLTPVLAAVQSVQDTPGSGPSATSEQIEVAYAVGVRPELVAAAAAEIEAAGGAAKVAARAEALRQYTGALRPKLLGYASTTAAQTQLIAEVPTRQGRLEKIESDIGELKDSIAEISTKIDNLAAPSPGGGGSGGRTGRGSGNK